MNIAVILVAILLGGLRVAGQTSPFFQGIAHIFVGGLGGAWLVGRNKLHLYLFIGLTVLEVACALFLKMLR